MNQGVEDYLTYESDDGHFVSGVSPALESDEDIEIDESENQNDYDSQWLTVIKNVCLLVKPYD